MVISSGSVSLHRSRIFIDCVLRDRGIFVVTFSFCSLMSETFLPRFLVDSAKMRVLLLLLFLRVIFKPLSYSESEELFLFRLCHTADRGGIRGVLTPYTNMLLS